MPPASFHNFALLLVWELASRCLGKTSALIDAVFIEPPRSLGHFPSTVRPGIEQARNPRKEMSSSKEMTGVSICLRWTPACIVWERRPENRCVAS